jgi:hypothetical protein
MAAAGSIPAWRAAATAARAGRVRRTRLPPARDTDAFHRRPGALGEDAVQGRVLAGDDQSRFRHYPDKVVKLPFNRGKIIEDVGMIHLQIVQYCGAGAVMHEFGALVEKGRVVLVGLDDEVRRLTEACRDRKILRHAAYQETGRAPCAL